mgnify:CR=1 FL=1
MQYKAAIIGCGRIGCGFDDTKHLRDNWSYTHAGAYAAVPQTDLVGLCDLDIKKANQYSLQYNATAYDDHMKMLREQRPDIVSICTAPTVRYQIIKDCIENGVQAIYCEKPIDVSVEEAHKTIALCEEANVILIVNHHRRFSRFYEQMAAGLRDSTLGDPATAGCGYSGGLYNTGTHIIDIMRLYFGNAVGVRGHLSGVPNANSADPNIDGFIYFENGVSATLHAHGYPGIMDLTVSTTKYKFHINLAAASKQRQLLSVEKRENNTYFPGAFKFVTNFDILEEIRALETSQETDYMIRGVTHLVECLEDKTVSPRSSGQEAAETLRILDALRASASRDSAYISLE